MNTKIADELHKRLNSVERLLKRRDDDVAEMAKGIGDLTEAYSKQRKAIEELEYELKIVKTFLAPLVTDKVLAAPIAPRADGVGRVVEERDVSVRQVYHVDTHGLTHDHSRRLLAIVTARWNMFGRVPHDEFHRALICVLNMKRLPGEQTDSKYALSWWIDNLEAWARANGMPGSICAEAILAACIASGDVAFTSPENWPHCEFGLAAPHVSGRTANDAWRQLLAGGRLPEPVATKRFVDHSLGYQRRETIVAAADWPR